MAYNRFAINILIRVVLMIATGIIAYRIFPKLNDEYYFLFLNLVIFLALQFLLLIRFLSRFNNDLIRFFQAIKNKEPNYRFPELSRFHPLHKIYKDFNNLNLEQTDGRIKDTQREHFLSNIVNQVDIGIIIYLNNEEVILINKEARLLLQLNSDESISKLKSIKPEVYNSIKSLTPDKSIVLKLDSITKDSQITLSMRKSMIKQNDVLYHIISFQDIKNEMDEQEMASWNKLIRILTHEIMNSLSPVISLSNSLNRRLPSSEKDNKLNDKEYEDLIFNTRDGLETIEATSQRLLDFVLKYRSLTSIPKPNFEDIKLISMVNNVIQLLSDDIEKQNIDLEIEIPETLNIRCDSALMEQVFINLIQNAINALQKAQDKKISIKAHSEMSGQKILSINDNGSGIPEEIQDKIFIPFFTTKDEGSGIGLSLSKQIVRLHGGSISFDPKVKNGSTFTIKL